MKEIRPKINEVELELLLEAMEKAGYNARKLLLKNSPLYQLYTRFKLLRKGSHVKLRVTERPQERELMSSKQIPQKCCPECGGPLVSRKFIETWDAQDKPEQVGEYLVCNKCEIAWLDLDLEGMYPYPQEEA